MITVTLGDLTQDVEKYLELAASEDVLILRNGKPAGLLQGFVDEADTFDYELEANPIFLARIEQARAEFRAGKGISIENVRAELAAEAEET